MAIGAQTTPRPLEDFLKNNSSCSLKASFRDFSKKNSSQKKIGVGGSYPIYPDLSLPTAWSPEAPLTYDNAEDSASKDGLTLSVKNRKLILDPGPQKWKKVEEENYSEAIYLPYSIWLLLKATWKKKTENSQPMSFEAGVSRNSAPQRIGRKPPW